MERARSSDSLVEIIENVFSALLRDYGHQDAGYCLACDNEPFEALEEIKEKLWRLDLLEKGLKTIQGWDMLNPPQTDVVSDLAWLKRLVDTLLEE